MDQLFREVAFESLTDLTVYKRTNLFLLSVDNLLSTIVLDILSSFAGCVFNFLVSRTFGDGLKKTISLAALVNNLVMSVPCRAGGNEDIVYRACIQDGCLSDPLGKWCLFVLAVCRAFTHLA